MLVRLNAPEHSLYSAENEDVGNVLFRFLKMPIKRLDTERQERQQR